MRLNATPHPYLAPSLLPPLLRKYRQENITVYSTPRPAATRFTFPLPGFSSGPIRRFNTSVRLIGVTAELAIGFALLLRSASSRRHPAVCFSKPWLAILTTARRTRIWVENRPNHAHVRHKHVVRPPAPPEELKRASERYAWVDLGCGFCTFTWNSGAGVVAVVGIVAARWYLGSRCAWGCWGRGCELI